MHFKTFLFFSFSMLVLGLGASAQTKIIAHESHGGEASSFSLEREDNFGLPSNFAYELDTVIKYKKNAVIEIFHKGNCISCRLVDTTKQHPVFNDPQVSLDSMQKLYPDVVFVNFGKVKHHKLKAGLQPSFEIFQNTEESSGISVLAIMCSLFFVLLTTFLWKQAKSGRT